ncbi:endonuclease/exonuclease/phosphatase family protein [Amycolatopsis sp. cmx-4-54]|uniref:endonuclease/exonuclease/phosphatase family protein n=1 Tax=Amycolatopsis sp. cmx-4-54 TaxID=2790936 RepID=UPI00397B7117
MHVRIVTINRPEQSGCPRRLSLLNQELRRRAPDLVALQEVVDGDGRRQTYELLEGAELNGTHQSDAMGYRPPFVDRHGGNAVATRWPHKVMELLDLRLAGAGDVPRCTPAVKVVLPGLGDLLFISVTASWRLDAVAVREQQAIALTDLDARHRTDLPIPGASTTPAPPPSSTRSYASPGTGAGSTTYSPVPGTHIQRHAARSVRSALPSISPPMGSGRVTTTAWSSTSTSTGTLPLGAVDLPPHRYPPAT